VAFYFRRAWLLAFARTGWEDDGLRTAVLSSLVVGTVVVAALFAVRARVLSGRWRPAGLRLWWLAAPLTITFFLLARRSPSLSLALPYFGEAVRRGAAGIGGAAVVSGDAWLLGAAILRMARVRLENWRERLPFQVAIGFGMIAYLSLGLAALGWYRRPTVIALILATASAAAAVLAGTPTPADAADDGPLEAKARWFRWPGADWPWVVVSVVAVAFAFVAALAPEIEYDALWYHLWVPKLWMAAGHPVDISTEYVMLYPFTFELVYGAGMAVGGAVAAKLLHWLCLPLTALVVFECTRRFLPGARPWAAAAVLVTTPTVFWESTTSYVDLALGLYLTLGVYSTLRYVGDGRSRRGAAQAASHRLWMAAVSLGLAAAIKHLALIAVAVVGVGLFVDELRRTRNPWRATMPGLAVSAVAFALASPWYARAWIATGNPFFPEVGRLFGLAPGRWDALSEQGLDAFKSRFGYPRTPLSIAALPWNVTMHGARFGGCLGWAFLATLPAIAARRISWATWWLLFILASYVALWASPVSSFQMRFLVPMAPVAAMLAAAGIGAILDLGRRRMRSIAAATGACLLAINLPPFTVIHEGDRHGWFEWLTHVTRGVPLPVVVGHQSADDYLRANIRTYGAWQYLSQAAPPDARVLEVGGGDEFYARRNRLPSDSMAARALWRRGNQAPPDVLDEARRLGISYVLIDKSWIWNGQAERLAISAARFRGQHLVLEWQDGGAEVYRIPDSARTAARRPPAWEGPRGR
jgi:hypothetical protein